MANPTISVIMPVYNAERYLRDAIESILGQDYPHFEFIIVDDCSTDQSLTIIREYTDPRMVVLRNENNSGVAASLNAGITAARGTYMARMDADDISIPERFRRQLNFLENHPEVSILGTWAYLIDSTGAVISVFSGTVESRVDFLFGVITGHWNLFHPTVMVRLNDLRSIGGYRQCEAEDYDLWARMARQGFDARVLPEMLFKYRRHEMQITNQNESRISSDAARKRLDLVSGIFSDTPIDRHLMSFLARSEELWETLSPEEVIPLAHNLSVLLEKARGIFSLNPRESDEFEARIGNLYYANAIRGAANGRQHTAYKVFRHHLLFRHGSRRLVNTLRFAVACLRPRHTLRRIFGMKG